ncbi:MAG: DinB family protein [Candidatus Sungbacteria bacterium]|nr:DinB family protein [Candidatus Sungbacteria bacterium]
MNADKKLGKALAYFLEHPHTHASFEDAVSSFPLAFINKKPKGVPYSFWELLEHIRLTQRDIIDFLTRPDYKEPEWPKGYWPKPGAKATKAMWDKAIGRFKKDFLVLMKIVRNPKKDLLTPLPAGGGQVFRGAAQIADHTGYHIGEFVLMRRVMGIWKR